MYDPKSMCADDFIDHQEILDTLAYAEEHKSDAALISSIIEKAKERKGLSHRDASVLLACDIEEKNQEIFALAEQIKKDFYGNRIVMFAPLYLSNYCVNGCTYCPYHAVNKQYPEQKADSGRNPPGGYRSSGSGSQETRHRSRRGPDQQSDRIHTRIHRDDLLRSPQKRRRSAASM